MNQVAIIHPVGIRRYRSIVLAAELLRVRITEIIDLIPDEIYLSILGYSAEGVILCENEYENMITSKSSDELVYQSQNCQGSNR